MDNKIHCEQSERKKKALLFYRRPLIQVQGNSQIFSGFKQKKKKTSNKKPKKAKVQNKKSVKQSCEKMEA